MLTLGPLRDLQSGRHGAVSPPALSAVELAIRNTGRQLELVDQLLMLARLDAGHPEFRPRELRLDEFLRQAVASYESLAARQQVQFRCNLPEKPVLGTYDERHLDHVIGNLLSDPNTSQTITGLGVFQSYSSLPAAAISALEGTIRQSLTLYDGTGFQNLSVSAVPEPTWTAVVTASALLGVGMARSHMRRRDTAV